MRLRGLLVAGVLTALVSSVLAQAATLQDVFGLEKDLAFDDLYPRRSHFGPRATVAGWSHDDRYMIYYWNPYREMGPDLYLFDRQSGQSTRLSSPDVMKAFDGNVEKAKADFDEELKRWEDWEKLSDSEFREQRLKFEEEERKRSTPRQRYVGPGEVSWAKTKNEFLMVYRGDIYRWKVGENLPTRLTWTHGAERNVQYLPDDSGFVFQRGNDVYRMSFDSPATVQINPQLENGVQMFGYSISPDGTKMMVYGNKAASGQNRVVDWIVYRERFAQAQRVSRGVADDEFMGETYLYLYDIRDEVLKDPQNEAKAFEIWQWKGGKEWQETSIADNPWSPDGRFFVFGSWKRDAKDFRILEANLEEKKVYPIHIGTSDGEHRTPSLSRPFYTPDGESVVALMDTSDWRHAYLVPRGRGEARRLTSGEFEVYPQGMSADGKSIIVTSSKEHLSRMDVYRVSLETGAMTRLTSTDGQWAYFSKANKSDIFAAELSSWNQMRELFVVDEGRERKLTDSHNAEAFWSSIKIKPELFTYTNRHGDTIHGYQFLPPDLKPGEKRPLFIYVYGGPLGTGKSVIDGVFNTSATLFNMYLTHTLGYITVTVDPRGQSGYSGKFGKANWDQVGVAQTEDMVDLVKHMEATYGVDRTKVGMTGWSFGGFQTQHAMYTEPDWFTLGIAGAGPTQWQNYNTWYSGGVVGFTRKGQPDDLDKYSLTHVAKNLKSPLLLLHGMEDTNVLYQDTVMVYRKLLQAGKGPIVELSLDPTGGHGMGGDMDNRDRHLIYLAFIVKHWGIPGYLSRN